MAEDNISSDSGRIIEPNSNSEIMVDKPPGRIKSILRYKEKRPSTLDLQPPLDLKIPPSLRPLPERDSFDYKEVDELLLLLDDLLEELEGRREGYRFYPDLAEREELRQISERTANYLHENGIRNFVILDRSARPAYIGVKEMWKKKYPNDPLPDVYFVNPTGFVNIEDAMATGKSGLPRAAEIMFDGLTKGVDLASTGLGPRTQEDIEGDFRESYQRLTTNRNQPTLLFDNCIHSGNSLRPVKTTLENIGFTQLKTGVVGEERNISGIIPDFVAIKGEPLGICYPFDKDRMVERRFDSVTSSATQDVDEIEYGVALRKEIHNIINGTHPEITKELVESVQG